MPFTINFDHIHLILLNENGETTEELDGDRIRKEISTMEEIVSIIPLESLVSLRMKRGRDMLLAMITLLQRGTPFVSLSPEKESVSKWSLCDGNVVVEKCDKDVDELPSGIAYTIFTSGTTGTRKRVDVPVECISLNINDFSNRFCLSSSSRILLCTSFHFDPSLVDILLWITVGCTLILSSEVASNPRSLSPALANHDVSFVQLCPSLLSWLTQSDLRYILSDKSTLTTLLLGGEPFPLSLISSLRSSSCHTRIFDIYGITEVSCWATAKEVEYGCKRVTLGEPIEGTQLKVDDHYKLWIGGERRRCTVDGMREGEWTDSGDKVERVKEGWIVKGRDGDETKLYGVRMNMCATGRLVEGIEGVQWARIIIYKKTFLVLFVKTERELLSEELNELLPHGLSFHHVQIVNEVPLNSSGKTDVSQLIQLLETTKTANEENLKEFLQEYGLSDSLKGEMTLKETGMDSSSMLRLAFLLNDPAATRLILSGDCTVEQLRRVMRKEMNPIQEQLSGVKNGSEKVEYDLPISLDSSSLSMKWEHEMEKCVDATPLLFINSQSLACIVIGSHSGLVACLQSDNGNVIWESRMTHRVETAAVHMEECGIVVCSYDGIVHLLDELTGEEKWNHSLGTCIRAQSVVGRNGDLFIGDYSECLHRLDIKSLLCLWSSSVGGNVRASSCVVDYFPLVITVTLNGIITCLDTKTGEEVWRVEGRRPFFAPPIQMNDNIVIVDIDGHISVHGVKDGKEIASMRLHSRVFTPPTLLPSGEFILVTADERGKGSSIVVLSSSLDPLHILHPCHSLSFFHSPIIHYGTILITSSCGLLLQFPIKIDKKENMQVFRIIPPGGDPLFSQPLFTSSTVYFGARDDRIRACQWQN